MKQRLRITETQGLKEGYSMGKQSRKKTSANKNIFTSGFVFSKVNAVMLVLFLIVEAIYYYI